MPTANLTELQKGPYYARIKLQESSQSKLKIYQDMTQFQLALKEFLLSCTLYCVVLISL
jgi:hypothetical protein